MVIRIGLAMLQGARHEHVDALYNAALELELLVEVIPLRSADDLLDLKLDGIVLPGGESTTMRKASESHGLLSSIFTFMDENPFTPILGTCAGAILLVNPEQGRKPYLDAEIDRNAYGGQKNSFQALLKMGEISIPSAISSGINNSNIIEGKHKPLIVNKNSGTSTDTEFQGVFIRAPRFKNIGKNVGKVVFNDEEVVGIFENNKLALSFHPELTSDYRFHRWLLSKASMTN